MLILLLYQMVDNTKSGTYCSGQISIYTRITTRVPPYQCFPEDRRQDVPTGYLPKASSRHFHGHSCRGLLFREHFPSGDSTVPRPLLLRLNYLKINSSRPEQNRCTNWPPWSSPTFMESVMPPAHPCFKRTTTLILFRVLQKLAGYHSSNQEHNLSRYKEILTCQSCDYRNLHDSHQL